MIFTETALAGAFIIDLERREDERGYFARAFCQRRVRRARPEAGDRAGERRLQQRAPARCAACISSFRRRPRRRSSAARAARSSTSSSTCGPRARRTSRASRSSSTRRTARAVRAGAVRARLPDARRRHRDELLRRRVLRARDRGRSRLRRSAAGARTGRCRSRSSPRRTREWEPLDDGRGRDPPPAWPGVEVGS